MLPRLAPPPPENGSLSSSARWRLARARVLALQGELEEAESHARAATALAASTDLLNLRGDVMLVLADVLEAEARSLESAVALGEAVRLYEQKGNVAAAGLAHSQLQARASRPELALSPAERGSSQTCVIAWPSC
jgi:hypothetical protein